MKKRFSKIIVGVLSLSLLTGCKKEVSYREFQQEVNKAEEKRYEKAIVEGKAYTKDAFGREMNTKINISFTYDDFFEVWSPDKEIKSQLYTFVMHSLNANIKYYKPANDVKVNYYLNNGGFEIHSSMSKEGLENGESYTMKSKGTAKYDEHLFLMSYTEKASKTTKFAKQIQNISFKVTYN